MPKKVALVGHCGPDSSFLRIAVSRAERDIQVVSVDDDSDLKRLLDEGVDLLLLNRQLDYGFDEDEGVALIPEAQAAAVAEGALPGFGKREIGTPRVGELLREALKPAQPSAAPASAQGKRV
jgi:two-component system, chemotaxis family, chemotaxis protein CheY